MQRLRAVVVLIVSLAVVSCGSAPSQTATINGHVFARHCPLGNCHPGDPLVGVRVRFERDVTRQAYEVVTDDRGWYSISLPPGKYSAQAAYGGTSRASDPAIVLTDWNDGPRTLDVRAGTQVTADYALIDLLQ